MTNLISNQQTAEPGVLITMFRLDTSSIGGPVMNFCQAAQNNTGITYGGVYYTPVDVEFKGFEIVAGGGLPQPKVKLANSNGVFQAVVNTYGDLVGCEIQRIRTFSQFLDGQPGADPTAFYGPDMFRVERKTNENLIFIEWELSASVDNQGAQIPARMVIRDTCTWRYRIWNPISTTFDYSKAQCPYVGSIYDVYDAPQTNGALDDCGRTVNSCKLRFGGAAPLPFGGFPGVARFH